MMKLNQLTVIEAREGLKAKKFSVIELVTACLAQIKSVDKKLHAFLTLNDQVVDQAKKLDQAGDNGRPLWGIPFALKDNFLTEGLRTTASTKVLDDYVPQYSATVYKKLIEAGALCLGKTNMDAWAHGSSTETSDFGPTLNPWNVKHLPGGSSGGSAAAVAADMCIFAIGSETAGSVRQPAAWCGVTGFKPTYGRVSRYGVVAMASSTDSPGPLTKTVADAALITKIIAGHDGYDATTSPRPVDIDPGKLQVEYLKKLKIALPKEYLVAPASSRVLEAVKVFESAGAKVEPVALMDPQFTIAVYTIIQRCEVSSNLARYDGIRFGHDRSSFSFEAKNRSLLGAFSLSTGYFDQYYKKAQQVRTMIIDEFDRLFKDYDFYLAPVSPGPALPLGASKTSAMFGELQDVLVEPSSIAGLTGLSVPCGFINGLPIGLQITGAQFDEQKILQAGHWYQQQTKWHLEKPKL